MTSLAIATNFVLSTSYGMSAEAQKVQKNYFEVQQDRRQNRLYRDPYWALRNAAEECSQEDWDGYGAKRIDRKSFEESLRFLEYLPSTLPTPEVSVEPDGMVAFEWYKRSRWVFSVSFGTNKEIIYAGLFGNSKTHGTEYFGEEMPQTILDNIRRVNL